VDANGKIWHRTGDLAFEDTQGYLWIVGRIHNVIMRADRYYFPVRAEVILKRLPFVKQAAFLGMPDSKLKEKTAIAVVLENRDMDKKYAKEEILRLFGKNHIPVDALYFVDHIPMDPRHHSKVEYSVLREELKQKEMTDELR